MHNHERSRRLQEQLAELTPEQLDILFGALFEGASTEPIRVAQAYPPAFGAFSAVFRVDLQRGSEYVTVAIKTGKGGGDIAQVDDHYLEHLLAGARSLPSVMEQYGVYAITAEQQLLEVTATQEVSSQEVLEFVFQVLAAMPESAVQLLQLLRSFGLETIQSGRTGAAEMKLSQEQLTSIYEQIMTILADVHGAHVAGFTQDERTAEYQTALNSIVTDPSRFDGVASCLDNSSTLSAEHVQVLRDRMLELASKIGTRHAARLSHVHADAWASNFFLDPEDNRILCIDPGTVPYSDPALDLMFALADLLFLQVNGNVRNQTSENIYQGNFTELAQQLLQQYQERTGDTVIPQILPLFYGFKAFVSAVFDAGSNEEQRMRLYYSALGTVDRALAQVETETPFEFAFSAEALQAAEAHGQALLS